jgi:capsular exopolysaccharide synthesis family protein
MSRIFEAMKRAAAQQEKSPEEMAAPTESGAAETPNVYDAMKRIVEKNSASSPLNNISSIGAPTANTDGGRPSWERNPGRLPAPTSTVSASTAHTDSTYGTALPNGLASRDAGATLDAAGTTRQPGNYVSVEISPARVEPHLVSITQPRSAYTEQFRNLRSRVLHAGEKKGVQVVVVTSSGVAEGKTLTSLNLSWMMAQTEGVSALLIDSDLRRPCAAQYLGLQAPNGLSEVLGGEIELDKAIVRLEPSGLYLLPGGAARENVAEMLAGPTFGKLLKQLRQRFDFIIIDAPPMGVFSDASTLINRSDGALLVVRANKTKYKSVERLLDGVPRERMLGVVLNHADEKMPEESYYGYGYGYRPFNTPAASEPEQLEEAVA